MKVHEYQARQILADYGVPVPNAEVVKTPEEAADAFKKFAQDGDAEMCVVKAQVYAGGRGKAGFVKLCKHRRRGEKGRRVHARQQPHGQLPDRPRRRARQHPASSRPASTSRKNFTSASSVDRGAGNTAVAHRFG